MKFLKSKDCFFDSQNHLRKLIEFMSHKNTELVVLKGNDVFNVKL